MALQRQSLPGFTGVDQDCFKKHPATFSFSTTTANVTTTLDVSVAAKFIFLTTLSPNVSSRSVIRVSDATRTTQTTTLATQNDVLEKVVQLQNRLRARLASSSK